MAKNETERKSLKDRAIAMDAQLPIMEGREKGELTDLIGTFATIDDFGFLPGKDGTEFAVITVKEEPGLFFFGGMVVSNRLKELDSEGYADAVREEGLPFLMTKKKSPESGRTYTNVTFYPDENPAGAAAQTKGKGKK